MRLLIQIVAAHASRLLSILIMLQMRGRLSAEALAQEFEVSIRTIYRDIDQLSAAGVPVYAERGRAGGFELHEGYAPGSRASRTARRRCCCSRGQAARPPI